MQPITPGALLASALASNPAFTPALSGDGTGNLERRRLEFGTPASLSLGPPSPPTWQKPPFFLTFLDVMCENDQAIFSVLRVVSASLRG